MVELLMQHPNEILFPDLMTEEEVIDYLRIPKVSKAGEYNNVINNLKRAHGLPCIHISRKPLYPREAVWDWVMQKVLMEGMK